MNLQGFSFLKNFLNERHENTYLCLFYECYDKETVIV